MVNSSSAPKETSWNPFVRLYNLFDHQKDKGTSTNTENSSPNEAITNTLTEPELNSPELESPDISTSTIAENEPLDFNTDLAILLKLMWLGMSQTLEEKGRENHNTMKTIHDKVKKLNNGIDVLLTKFQESKDKSLKSSDEDVSKVLKELKALEINIVEKETLKKDDIDIIRKSVEDRRQDLETDLQLQEKKFSEYTNTRNSLIEIVNSSLKILKEILNKMSNNIRG